MAVRRKAPLRSCIACRRQAPKKELVRVVRGMDGKASVDLTGKANGRGAYLCADTECVGKARKGGRLGQALGVEIGEGVYAELMKAIEGR